MAYREQTFLTSAARTASANSSSYDFSDQKEVAIFLSCTAASGTTPTLTVYIDTSADGTNWSEYGTTFDVLTTTGNAAVGIEKFGKYVRIRCVIAGTNPSFTFSVIGIGK